MNQSPYRAQIKIVNGKVSQILLIDKLYIYKAFGVNLAWAYNKETATKHMTIRGEGARILYNSQRSIERYILGTDKDYID